MGAVDRVASRQEWAIVLAGGDGRRLQSLTMDDAGNAVPKQFCSLNGGSSLIAHTLARAKSIVGRERITTVVSAAHTRHWQWLLQALPSENVVVQPLNRGTGIGILLPTLRIAARDPDATLLILPSDHHVADEGVLESAMRTAFDEIRTHPSGVALLGIQADQADPELGYIVPSARHGRMLGVQRFIEKPPIDDARRLSQRGALWNSFILACRARSLIALYASRYGGVVRTMRATDLADYGALVRTYRKLPELDFSRDIATGQEQLLSVMPVPRCGWSDLGCPRRLAQTLRRAQEPSLMGPAGWPSAMESSVSLAERLKRADRSPAEDRSTHGPRTRYR